MRRHEKDLYSASIVSDYETARRGDMSRPTKTKQIENIFEVLTYLLTPRGTSVSLPLSISFLLHLSLSSDISEFYCHLLHSLSKHIYTEHIKGHPSQYQPGSTLSNLVDVRRAQRRYH